MADWDDTTRTDIDSDPRRRFPDPVRLVIGLLTLLAATYALTDGRFLHGVDPRWLIAGAALLLGVLLLGASLRPGRRQR